MEINTILKCTFCTCASSAIQGRVAHVELTPVLAPPMHVMIEDDPVNATTLSRGAYNNNTSCLSYDIQRG